MSLDPSNRYRDQISPYQYDQYREFPGTNQIPRSQDRIESSQERLERSLLDQFRHNNFRLPATGKFILIAHAGRFLILAIVIPPYIFFYGMPKWMLQQILPVVSEKVDQMGNWLEKSYLRISAWSANLFSGMAQNFRGSKEAKKKKKREGENLFQLLIKESRHIMQASLVFLNRAYQMLNGLNARIQQPAKHVVRKSFSEVRSIFVKFHKILQQQGENIATSFVEAYKRIVNSFKRSLDWIGTKWQAQKFNERLNHSLQILIHWIPPLNFQMLRPNWNLFKKALWPLSGLREKLYKPLEIAMQMVSSTVQWLNGKIGYGFQWMLQKTAAHANRIEAPLLQMFKRVNSLINTFLRHSRAALNYSKHLIAPVATLLKTLQGYAKKMLNQFNQSTKKYRSQAKLIAIKVMREIHLLPSRLASFLKWLIKFLYQLVKRILWGMRVGLTWAKIIIIHRIKESRFNF